MRRVINTNRRRDNILTPANGILFESELATAQDWLGSSKTFNDFSARVFGYKDLGRDWNLGLRADVRAAGEGTPFYLRPFVSLRGVPAMRYQDTRAVMAEAELKYRLTPRWSVLGFAGVGKAFGDYRDFSDAEDVYTKGAGFRYLIASRLGLQVGIDVARGPEDTAFYIQVGSAWR